MSTNALVVAVVVDDDVVVVVGVNAFILMLLLLLRCRSQKSNKQNEKQIIIVIIRYTRNKQFWIRSWASEGGIRDPIKRRALFLERYFARKLTYAAHYSFPVQIEINICT
jgi:hypothetical protein